MDEVELKILPRRDVQHGVCILFREIGQRIHLLGSETAKRDLDALHARGVPKRLRTFGQILAGIGQLLRLNTIVAMAIVVTLAICAATKSRLGEDFFIKLALLTKGNLFLENINFVSELRLDTVC